MHTQVLSASIPWEEASVCGLQLWAGPGGDMMQQVISTAVSMDWLAVLGVVRWSPSVASPM